MTPDIKNFIFIGDERQNNQTYNMVIKQELKKSHPDINYQFISPRKMQTNHLLDTLYTVDPKTTEIRLLSCDGKNSVPIPFAQIRLKKNPQNEYPKYKKISEEIHAKSQDDAASKEEQYTTVNPFRM